jgi:hypothetical protein
MNRITGLRLVCVAACLGLAGLGVAQQGYPLSGTWSGDWGPSVTQRNQITVVMDWDGKRVFGLINPGPNSTPLAGVSLDVANWGVRIEADGKDQAGKPVHITAEGRLDDIGSYHRTIRGTWHQGEMSGDFKLTRD